MKCKPFSCHLWQKRQDSSCSRKPVQCTPSQPGGLGALGLCPLPPAPTGTTAEQISPTLKTQQLASNLFLGKPITDVPMSNSNGRNFLSNFPYSPGCYCCEFSSEKGGAPSHAIHGDPNQSACKFSQGQALLKFDPGPSKRGHKREDHD